MTVLITFLTEIALRQIAGAGWIDVGVKLGGDPLDVIHRFEDPARALVLEITYRECVPWTQAEVNSSYFHFGTRDRFEVAPAVYTEYVAGRTAANALRAELRFLGDHGIDLLYARLHRLTEFGKSRRVVEMYYIGPSAAELEARRKRGAA